LFRDKQLIINKFHELYYPKISENEAKSSSNKEIDTHTHKPESADRILPVGSDAISAYKVNSQQGAGH
jgi:hypothetical protein